MSKLKKIRRFKTPDEFTTAERVEAMKIENGGKQPRFETDEYKRAVAASIGVELTDEDDGSAAPIEWRDDSDAPSVEAQVKAMSEGNQR